jgi:dTDP-4-dehydrorhamnose 3,5-epimerase
VIFRKTPLIGAYLIEPQRVEDARGYFARTWCAAEFADHGLPVRFAQCSTSYNARRGTLRGLHFQAPPHAEGKLVRCTRGAIFDVIVDLRPASPSHRRWFAAELTAENALMMYAPEGFAHGFQTLADASEVFYQITVPFRPKAARGLRWDDPAIGVTWPIADPSLSEADRARPCLSEAPC